MLFKDKPLTSSSTTCQSEPPSATEALQEALRRHRADHNLPESTELIFFFGSQVVNSLPEEDRAWYRSQIEPLNREAGPRVAAITARFQQAGSNLGNLRNTSWIGNDITGRYNFGDGTFSLAAGFDSESGAFRVLGNTVIFRVAPSHMTVNGVPIRGQYYWEMSITGNSMGGQFFRQ